MDFAEYTQYYACEACECSQERMLYAVVSLKLLWFSVLYWQLGWRSLKKTEFNLRYHHIAF